MSAFEGLKNKVSSWRGADEEDFESVQSDNYEQPMVSRPQSSDSSSKVFTCSASTMLHIVVKKPKKYTDASEIIDLYRTKKSVIIMLKDTNKDTAYRIIDFIGGASYMSDGNFKRIGESTFVLSPYNVDISGEIIDQVGDEISREDIYDSLG